MIRNPELDNPYSDASVARRCKVFRLGLGLTQGELSEQVGSEGNGQLWDHYEKGRRLIPTDKAAILTHKHGLDIRWLYQGRMIDLEPRFAEIVKRGEQLMRDGGKLPKRRKK